MLESPRDHSAMRQSQVSPLSRHSREHAVLSWSEFRRIISFHCETDPSSFAYVRWKARDETGGTWSNSCSGAFCWFCVGRWHYWRWFCTPLCGYCCFPFASRVSPSMGFWNCSEQSSFFRPEFCGVPAPPNSRLNWFLVLIPVRNVSLLCWSPRFGPEHLWEKFDKVLRLEGRGDWGMGGGKGGQ
jgi:hypothetical protein